jgi:GNAT superfamily N-acetyltransferase
MTTEDDVVGAADANMLATWLAVVACSPAPGVVEREGVQLLSTGAPVGLFNPVFAFSAVDDADSAVRVATEHYAALGVPFVLYFRDALTPTLADACARAGLVEHWQPPIMVLDPVPASEPTPPAGVAITTIDGATLEDYASTLAAGFGMPPELGALVANEKLLESGYIGFLATIGGEPVATSGVFVSDRTAGVYTVSTRAEHRGRGIGAAITWAAVRAGAAAGATHAILQSSQDGEPVYRRMGFVTADRYRQFEQAPAGS